MGFPGHAVGGEGVGVVGIGFVGIELEMLDVLAGGWVKRR